MALVAFSVVMSFITPLAPGLSEATPTVVKSGAQQILVKGYKTDFKDASNGFWLAAEGRKFILPGKIVEVKSPSEALVSFDIPAELPVHSLNLINKSSSNCLMLVEAVYVDGATIKPALTNASENDLADVKSTAFTFPFKSILYESIRNLNFHVTMWFALLGCMLLSVVKSIQYLNKGDLKADRTAFEGVNAGLLFGILGLITGTIWARFTWGAWWVKDVKLNGAAVSVLIYLAYIVLRNSINEEQKRARIAAVYNIFAFVMLIVFIQVLPRMTQSLHPGNGGNPAFSQYDLDNNMRMIFYPATLGWILIGLWIAQIRSRWSELNYRIHHHA